MTHVYKEEVNFYGKLPPNKIGYSPVVKTIICGKIREPNEQEYFLYLLENEY